MELRKPSIEKIGEKFYWICSSEEVHLINHERSEDVNFYAHKLTVEELDDLPVEVVYVGTDNFSFLDDEQAALSILVKIIEKMNMMQAPEFYSFPLGL